MHRLNRHSQGDGREGEREGLRGVRIREVGQSMLGSRLEYRVDNVDEVGRGDSSRQKNFLLGLRG